MTKILGRGLALGLLAGAILAAQDEPGIRVWLFDYTGLDTETLAKAKLEATEVLGKAGIRTSWLPCRVPSSTEPSPPVCGQSLAENDVVLRIVTAAPARADSSLGMAMVAKEGGMFATVYRSRVEELAKLRVAGLAQVLGHAMAHEIGHLLLGEGSHASSGIMKAWWERKDLENMNRGWLAFTARQADQARASVSGRSAAGRASVARATGSSGGNRHPR